MFSYKTIALAGLILPLSLTLHAADPKSSDTPVSALLSSSPELTTTASLSVREMFDSNVYLQNVTAEARKGSMISNAVPSLVTVYTPGADTKATFNYCEDINIFHSAPSESYTRSTGGAGLVSKAGDWSTMINAGAVAVNGSNIDPTYTGPGGSPAIGGGDRQARRDQDIYTGAANVAYSPSDLVLRPVATWRDQAFHDFQTSAAGYQNYVNRTELVEGLDLGWKATPTLTTFVSYRVGQQRQDNLLGVINNFSNDINRAVVGIEGASGAWLKVNLLMGEDQRRFTSAAVGLDDQRKNVFYSNSTATVTLPDADTLALSYVRFLQPSFSGRNAYEDITAEAQYRHALSAQWLVGAGAKANEGFFETLNRRDSIYYGTATVAFRITGNSTVSLDYQYATTNTSVPNRIDTSGRNFTRDQYSVSYKLTL